MGEADIVYDIKSGIFQFYCTNCKTLQECSVKENDSGKIRCRGCRCEIFFFLNDGIRNLKCIRLKFIVNEKNIFSFTISRYARSDRRERMCKAILIK